jgi:hypothetical protein
MGIWSVPATKTLKAGLKADDIDLIELNEAFAAQSIACINELSLDRSKININGGQLPGVSARKRLKCLLNELEKQIKTDLQQCALSRTGNSNNN